MGGVAARPSMNSPPRGGSDKHKMEKGYINGGYTKMGSRRVSDQKPSNKDHQERTRPSSGGDGGNGTDQGKLVTKEKDNRGSGKTVQEGKERVGSGGGGGSSGGSRGGGGSSGSSHSGGGKEGGNITERISRMFSKPGEPDELVDGWPKWLTDNIPKGALDGLVPKSAEAYDKLDKVGQGTYSNVYKARDKETGKLVALKKVRFDTSEPESVKFMAREITILRKLDHPNIVKLEGLATSRMQYSIYLVFDYMLTDLSRIISRPDDTLTEPQVKCYMQQLLSGLQHCHSRGILHRDIKGSNLLIDRNGMLKIADLGLANYYNPEKKQRLTNRVVTLWYRAPELLLGSTDYGPGIDLWSAGCLMAEMFAGRPIMPARTEVEQLHRIFKLCGTPSEEYWKKLKVATTFRPPHSYKPNLKEAFREFPKSSIGLLKILLALDPGYRGSASSALQNEFFYTTPLACDLSGLPIIQVENDDEAIDNERRKQRRAKAKMKQRSQTLKREGRKKEQSNDLPTGDSVPTENQEPVDQSMGPSAFQSKESKEEGQPRLHSPSDSSQKQRNPSDAPLDSANNVNNRPPLPNGTSTRGSRYNDDNEMYKLSQVQRSVSTREFRRMDQRELSKLRALVD